MSLSPTNSPAPVGPLPGRRGADPTDLWHRAALTLARALADVSWRVPCAADPDTWFPGRGGAGAVARARELCAECPVRGACLDYALAADERWGIWGGLTAQERADLARSPTTGGMDR